MDSIANPFSPGAGAPPPELVGREPILQQAETLLGRIHAGKPEKSLLLVGLRGVGKTVLLNEIQRTAERRDFRTITLDAHDNKPLGVLMAQELLGLLYDLNRMRGIVPKVRRALSILRSFIGTLKIEYRDVAVSIDVDPARGYADSGDIELDLPHVLVALGEAAQAQGTAVALFIDEIQYFEQRELGALIMAMHRIQQKQLPIALLGAGLPDLPRLAGESKSYAERLFAFPGIGALSQRDSNTALQDPAKAAGASFDEAALEEIFRLTQGYPYFLQEWGYQSWNHAPTPAIDKSVIQSATPTVIARLDENFFRVRFDRLSPSENRFLRSLAELEASDRHMSRIAESLEIKATSLGPLRSNLIKKGMIYSPKYGQLDFTVPLFDDFMKRTVPVAKRRM